MPKNIYINNKERQQQNTALTLKMSPSVGIIPTMLSETYNNNVSLSVTKTKTLVDVLRWGIMPVMITLQSCLLSQLVTDTNPWENRTQVEKYLTPFNYSVLTWLNLSFSSQLN